MPAELEKVFLESWHNQKAGQKTQKQLQDMKKGIHGSIKNIHKREIIPRHQVICVYL